MKYLIGFIIGGILVGGGVYFYIKPEARIKIIEKLTKEIVYKEKECPVELTCRGGYTTNNYIFKGETVIRCNDK